MFVGVSCKVLQDATLPLSSGAMVLLLGNEVAVVPVAANGNTME